MLELSTILIYSMAISYCNKLVLPMVGATQLSLYTESEVITGPIHFPSFVIGSAGARKLGEHDYSFSTQHESESCLPIYDHD